MVERPLEEHRPIGPFVNLGLESDPDRVIGTSGVSMPGKSKAKLVAVYVLEGKHQTFLPRDLGWKSGIKRSANTGALERKIKERYDVDVKPKEAGPSSNLDFENQAVIVDFQPEELPIQDNELHRVADIIDRHYDDSEVGNLVLDTGKGGVI